MLWQAAEPAFQLHPHIKSLGSLQALRLHNILGRSVWYAEVAPWEAGPWILMHALPLTGCVTLDKRLSWASVFLYKVKGV